MKTQQIDETQDFPVSISDAAWQSIHPFLKTLPNVYVGNPEDCRRFLSALTWITYAKKARRGVRCRKFTAIGMPSIDVSADGAMKPGSLKNSMNIFMRQGNSPRSSLIQRSCVPILLQRVPRKKNGGQKSEALGRSRGGFTTKLNAAVNDAFLPLRFTLTAGARHDVTQAPR